MTRANTKKAPSPKYEVGYGKPPVHTRFPKGQSGNPSGRPKRKATERAKEIALQEAYRLVPVREGDKIVKLPAIQAVQSQIALAAKGNGPAQRAVLRVVQAIRRKSLASWREHACHSALDRAGPSVTKRSKTTRMFLHGVTDAGRLKAATVLASWINLHNDGRLVTLVLAFRR